MIKSLKILLLVFVTTNSIAQIEKNDLLFFINGSFKNSTRQTESYYESTKIDIFLLPESYSQEYKKTSSTKGETGVKFLFSQNLMAGISILLEDERTKTVWSSIRKDIEINRYGDTLVQTDTYIENYDSRIKSLTFKPGISYIKNISQRATLTLNLDLLIKKSTKKYTRGWISNDHAMLPDYVQDITYWTYGFSFDPAVLIKVYTGTYLSYSPLKVTYLKDKKQEGIRAETVTDISANFTPLSLGIYFNLNGKN